jgi:ribulose-5-phosphate 4-epimerase/fuculose-1-phosphate aldolase
MSKQTDIAEVHKKLYTVGAAILRVNGNNTHSGNLSVRDPENPDVFYITASGSQGGALAIRDIVPVRFSDVSWGDARASSESTIHRRILSIPGANASIHCHHIACTIITFDSKDKQIFLRYLGTDKKGREEFLFQPVDLYGAYIAGRVRVGTYTQPVGSAEMEERIPKCLSDSHLTLVRGHGPFSRGSSPEECLYRLSVLEGSAILAINLRRRGMDLGRIQRKIMGQGVDSVFPLRPHTLDVAKLTACQVDDEATKADFAYWLSYNYNFGIGAYGTGSMSQKTTEDEMIYCPMSAVPEAMDFPLYRVSLDTCEEDMFDQVLHKLIYNNTNYATCMITTNPMATAEGMAVLAEAFGTDVLLGEKIEIPYTAKEHPVVVPIDAEAIYLNPRLGLVDISQLTNRTPDNPILNMLRWHKGCCVVAGCGVISVGDTTLEQAAHNVASAERIARFRAEVFVNEKLLDGMPVEFFEPRTI